MARSRNFGIPRNKKNGRSLRRGLAAAPFLLQLVAVAIGGADRPAVASAIQIESPPPTILDTDYGSFIDDIFAVGLFLQSTDVLDPRLIITTAEQPQWSAVCVAQQIHQSSGSNSNSNKAALNISVAIGETLPPYSERGSVCGIPGLVGFALKEECASAPVPPGMTLEEDGVAHAANMLEDSERTDWTYIVVGGQSSLAALIRDHFGVVSARIETLVIMGGNWCTGFDAYPGVPAPTAETNIGCDIDAANYVLEKAAEAERLGMAFPTITYVPVATVNVLSGEDYEIVLDAATESTLNRDRNRNRNRNRKRNRDGKTVDGNHTIPNNATAMPVHVPPAIAPMPVSAIPTSNPHYSRAAKVTVDLYRAWSVAARADPGLLVHREAMTFDPATESTPQFDAVAVLVAMDLVRSKQQQQQQQRHQNENQNQNQNDAAVHRVALREFANGVRFSTVRDEAAGGPKAAYSLWSGNEDFANDIFNNDNDNNNRDIYRADGKCRGLTPHHFGSLPAASDSDSTTSASASAATIASGVPAIARTASIRAALGFVSPEAEREFFHEMALRISGRWKAQPKAATKQRQQQQQKQEQEQELAVQTPNPGASASAGAAPLIDGNDNDNDNDISIGIGIEIDNDKANDTILIVPTPPVVQELGSAALDLAMEVKNSALT